jgi:hypothetical protein
MIHVLQIQNASGATSKSSIRSLNQPRKLSHKGVEIVFMFAALSMFCCNVARAQIVPGPLSSVHKDLGTKGTACNACHPDPHGISPQANLDCETCHTSQQWKSLLPFDHSRTRVKLQGSHQVVAQALPCIMCHSASAHADGGEAGTAPGFSRTSVQCSKCHLPMDPHGGQFSSPANRRKDCSFCHIPEAWNAGGFDHDSVDFALSGAHRKAVCTKCHKEQKDESGSIVRVYRSTPADCLKCH